MSDVFTQKKNLPNTAADWIKIYNLILLAIMPKKGKTYTWLCGVFSCAQIR